MGMGRIGGVGGEGRDGEGVWENIGLLRERRCSGRCVGMLDEIQRSLTIQYLSSYAMIVDVLFGHND